MDGPDGVYGFVGNGVRSDFQPINEGSGLALGNPTNLNFPIGTPAIPAPARRRTRSSRTRTTSCQGLVQSFIDAIGNPDVRRGARWPRR
ncbi:glycoside hydrolase family 68 protein [Oerskovia sp. M15]